MLYCTQRCTLGSKTLKVLPHVHATRATRAHARVSEYVAGTCSHATTQQKGKYQIAPRMYIVVYNGNNAATTKENYRHKKTHLPEYAAWPLGSLCNVSPFGPLYQGPTAAISKWCFCLSPRDQSPQRPSADEAVRTTQGPSLPVQGKTQNKLRKHNS